MHEGEAITAKHRRCVPWREPSVVGIDEMDADLVGDVGLRMDREPNRARKCVGNESSPGITSPNDLVSECARLLADLRLRNIGAARVLVLDEESMDAIDLCTCRS